jgi:16S rRNA processing protein RimM
MVESLTDVAQRFAPGARLLVQGHTRELEVEAARAHKGRLLVRFVGIDDRDAALTLRGIVLEVPRSAVAPAPEGVYYHFELIACQVFDREAGELGRVKDVLEDGGGQLLEIEGAGRTLLLPFVRAYLIAVDVDAGRIELALPEGLIETCASTS